jgi:hypothetical protein
MTIEKISYFISKLDLLVLQHFGIVSSVSDSVWFNLFHTEKKLFDTIYLIKGHLMYHLI